MKHVFCPLTMYCKYCGQAMMVLYEHCENECDGDPKIIHPWYVVQRRGLEQFKRDTAASMIERIFV